MQTTLTVRHKEVSDPIKGYAREQVEGLSKYFERLVQADIILDQEGHRHIVEARVHTSNDTHFASAEATNYRTAIDQVVEKLRRQIKRHKEKLSGRPMTKEERERRAATAFAFLRGGAGEAAPREWDRITSDEAIARLHASGEEILVFVDSGDDVVKIARRFGDGGIDVVEAEAFEVEER